jgi:ammonia channel protein AmtB
LSDTAVFSPYHSCNGTNTAHRDHQFLFASGGESFYFFDLAGAGVVHVCGGAGAFVLSVFHKLELSKRGRRLQNVPLLRRRDTLGELKSDAQMKMRSRKLRPSRTSWRPDNILRNFVDWMYYRGTEEQENIESAALGVLILWTSWFCYTAGATEAISGKMAHAAVGRICTTICLAAASGGVTQAILSGLVQMASRHAHYNTNELANAVVASLVAVTGCCAFISPPWAIPIGCATVFIYHTGCFIEYCLGLHDGARVFPVHAVCGLWGLLCVGVFRKTCLVRELYENLCYCLNSDLPSSVDDQGRMILIQMGGGMFILLWSLVLVAILFAVMWYFPVKIALSCISYAFCGNDLKRGRLYFEGNLLFTHCGEIECPDLLTGTEHND